MEEKKADNIINETRKKIDIIDEEIYSNKKTLSSIDDLEENFASINRSLNKCIDLINKSMKGDKVNTMMNEMNQENTVRFSKTIYSLDDEREKISKDIKNLNDEKDETMKFLKKELEKENQESKNKEDKKEEE